MLETASGTIDAVAITANDLESLRQRLREAGAKTRAHAERLAIDIATAQKARRKQDLLDMLVVGGVTLTEVVRHPANVPLDVERAFELAYPGLANAGETLADVVGRSSAQELVGLVSGVKGKLFELELVEYLNAGHLANGVRAELVASATQPGYDIRVVDDRGQVIDELQAKATESAAYVREALEKYPGIDVTTTSEVYAQLVGLGFSAHVVDSGISEASLEQKVEAALSAGHHVDASDLVPSSAALAVIALSSFIDNSASLEQKAAAFGNRAAKAGVSGAAAKAALFATNTWWLGLAVGVGSRWLSSYGGNKRERYEALRRTVETLESRNKAVLPAGAV